MMRVNRRSRAVQARGVGDADVAYFLATRVLYGRVRR